MKDSRFEELPVWRAAVELAERIYAFTAKPAWKSHSSLRDRLERAAISVSNNIAEGYERGTAPELIRCLYVACGSAAEVRSMSCFLDRLASFREGKAEIAGLKSHSEGISRQLRAWADSRQNPNIKGPRHLTDRGRRATKAAREREEFLKQLRQTTSIPAAEPEG